MTKEEFRQLTSQNIIYLDGATGSNLMKAGMASGVCPEKWILEHKDVMLKLAQDYVKAGTNILYAPTFTSNRVKLKEYQLEDQMGLVITQLVEIAKKAASVETSSGKNHQVLIAGDLTMTGEPLVPMGHMEMEELIQIYKEQITYLVQAGVDLLVVETMMSLQEARAALIAAKEVCDLPVMVTVTFEPDGRTLFGTDAATAAVVLESLGAAAIGANCSTGPAHMEDVIRTMAKVTVIPIIAKPNAGLPSVDMDGNTYYDMDAITFAEEMQLLAQAGATILGGCCGTDPQYIRLLKEKIGTQKTANVVRRQEGIRYLSSERMTLPFTLDQGLMIVGERINPTGKKALQAQLREGNLDMVIRFTEEQEACGARILDINMGMSGIDEKDMMRKAVQEVCSVSSLPLSIDSSHVDVIETALRHYPGRALINSISLEKDKCDKLLPIAAHYGAMFILLPLSDKGLPENLEEKKQIIHQILEKALQLGMRKEDIIVDGLVATVGANPVAALETLETIRYCKELGLATICGLSNISFGMPERSFVNTAFLTLAIQAGLTMAIANPSQELLLGCALAVDLLLNKEDADMQYIEFAAKIKEKREAQQAKQDSLPKIEDKGKTGAAAPTNTAKPFNCEQTNKDSQLTDANQMDMQDLSGIRLELYRAVLKGNRKGIAQITKDALAQQEEPTILLNEILLPAINLVGEYFDKGRYFLPQLIASAEAMKTAIEILEPLLLRETDAKDLPVVIIATVEGDIHDIGKNLVALMLKNYGFRVIDLGKDVPKEKIIAAAKEHKAQIIALSALMTTTMQRMREVINFAQEQGVTAKVMIGGAVITQEYADEIGADGYSQDAAEAVKLAKQLLESDN